MKATKGQVALYLLLTIVAVFLLVLLNVDTFLAVRTKNRLQNGGDAAAIAAARKQGALLNDIGRLNIDHLVAAIDGDAALCEELVLRQRKAALLGPVEALRLANRAAKKNGLPVRDEFSRILENHVKDIRLVYSGGGNDGDPYSESYPGAWTEYATAIESVIGEGLATGPDNMEFYDAGRGHMLLNRHFYYAIGGRDWCWFFFNCYGLLRDYSSYHDWPPLPPPRRDSMVNSEIFSLHVNAVACALTDVFTPAEIVDLAARYASRKVTEEELMESYLITNREQTWFFYQSGEWGRWFDDLHLSGDDEGGDFPIVGTVKPVYNVRGGSVVCRCQRESESFATDTTSDLTWCAAAKPFGSVQSFTGEESPVNELSGFVVPAFTDARLIPVDAASGADLASADYSWVIHVREHLPAYLAYGPHHRDCYYCIQLQRWERHSFRESGIVWLKFNSDTCVRPTGGGGGHGGTSHGH